MLIDIRTITRVPGTELAVSGTWTPRGLDLEGGDYVFSDPIRFEGILSSAGQGVLRLKGNLSASALGTCARCLAPVPMPLAVPVEETFRPGLGPDGTVADDPTEDPSFGYEGHLLDPAEALRTALLLALPGRVLCRDDCRGLCPVCGNDRNTTECDCLETQRNRLSPFRDLEKLP